MHDISFAEQSQWHQSLFRY